MDISGFLSIAAPHAVSAVAQGAFPVASAYVADRCLKALALFTLRELGLVVEHRHLASGLGGRYEVQRGDGSVSYTHLDVYKRQGIGNTAEDMKKFAPGADILPGRMLNGRIDTAELAEWVKSLGL